MKTDFSNFLKCRLSGKFLYFMLRIPFPAKAQDTEVRVLLKGAEHMELNTEHSGRHLKPAQQ